MLSPKIHAFLNSTYGNLPTQLHHAGQQKVLMNPSDAEAAWDRRRARIVRVFNERGTFEAVAEVTPEDTMPGIVVAPLGYWERQGM